MANECSANDCSMSDGKRLFGNGCSVLGWLAFCRGPAAAWSGFFPAKCVSECVKKSIAAIWRKAKNSPIRAWWKLFRDLRKFPHKITCQMPKSPHRAHRDYLLSIQHLPTSSNIPQLTAPIYIYTVCRHGLYIYIDISSAVWMPSPSSSCSDLV